MSIEIGGPIHEAPRNIVNTTPLTAIGEAIYSPEAVESIINLSAFAGRALASAISGTLRIADIAVGSLSNMGSEQSGATPPVVSSPVGGSV